MGLSRLKFYFISVLLLTLTSFSPAESQHLKVKKNISSNSITISGLCRSSTCIDDRTSSCSMIQLIDSKSSNVLETHITQRKSFTFQNILTNQNDAISDTRTRDSSFYFVVFNIDSSERRTNHSEFDSISDDKKLCDLNLLNQLSVSITPRTPLVPEIQLHSQIVHISEEGEDKSKRLYKKTTPKCSFATDKYGKITHTAQASLIP